MTVAVTMVVTLIVLVLVLVLGIVLGIVIVIVIVTLVVLARSRHVPHSTREVHQRSKLDTLWGTRTGQRSSENINMNSHEHGTDVQNELAPLARDLRNAIPEVLKAFSGLHAAAFAEGALTAKTKELMALAIAVSQRCDGCIAAHARGAVRREATEAEVAETIGVAISMNGGPATVYGPRAFAAFKDFAAQAAAKLA